MRPHVNTGEISYLLKRGVMSQRARNLDVCQAKQKRLQAVKEKGEVNKQESKAMEIILTGHSLKAST